MKGPRARIACYGTVFRTAHVDAKLLTRRVPTAVPQFSSPGLDASFLINCGRFLSGKAAANETPSTYVKRLAGTDFRSSKTVVFYECSAELLRLLADLTGERGVEMAAHWYGTNGTPKTRPQEANGRMQRRVEIFKHLAALANAAKCGNDILILCVTYRKQRYLE